MFSELDVLFIWHSLLNHQDIFMHVLLDGRLEMSNNKAERAVKLLVMGRKNRLFSKAAAVPGLQE